MGLFSIGRKKKEEKVSVCSCGCSCGEVKESTVTNECCGQQVEKVCCIKVLGAGCKSCHEQYENAKTAVACMGLNVEVEYITNMEKVMEYGVMRMPAIVVNEKVVAMGRVLKVSEVEALLHSFQK